MISCIIESRVPFLISLFNFQGPIATLSRRQLKEYIILFSVCQYFFESFFEIFFNLFSFGFSWPFSLSEFLSRWELVYIITSQAFCQHFLQTFLYIFHYITRFVYSLPGVFVPGAALYTICWVCVAFYTVSSIWGMVFPFAISLFLSFFYTYLYLLLLYIYLFSLFLHLFFFVVVCCFQVGIDFRRLRQIA